MKKILEVCQYGEHDIRFNTDIDVKKDPEMIMKTVINSAVAMTTKLWGGNEISVLAMIRALSIADMAVSVNRKEMIKWLDKSSEQVANDLKDAKEQMEKDGIKVQTFLPGVKPSGVAS